MCPHLGIGSELWVRIETGRGDDLRVNSQARFLQFIRGPIKEMNLSHNGGEGWAKFYQSIKFYVP